MSITFTREDVVEHMLEIKGTLPDQKAEEASEERQIIAAFNNILKRNLIEEVGDGEYEITNEGLNAIEMLDPDSVPDRFGWYS